MPLFRRAAPRTQVEEKTEVALTRTRRSWFGRIAGILDRGKIDDELWLELEEVLLGADVGVTTTEKILDAVRERVEKEHIRDAHDVRGILKDELIAILEAVPLQGRPLGRRRRPTPPRPGVILVVGVNGTGKTTSIAKLAHLYRQEGESVVVARRRHLPRRRHRPAQDLGRARRRPGRRAQGRRRPRRRRLRRRSAPRRAATPPSRSSTRPAACTPSST